MKKLVITSIVMLFAIAIAGASYAADQTLSSNVNASVGSIFSMAFYTDAKVLYSTNVPFSSVDPSSAFNYADDRTEDDGKSDVGLVIKSNQGNPWYLKIKMNAASPLLTKLGAFTGQPKNRNWDSDADGGVTYGDWFPITAADVTIYTAGTGDQTNTPEGTLATLNFKVDGSGLVPGPYTATITYTLTETA
ncbi:MAG: hypothetical protein ISS92_05430 [Candidatus Omnitrophica bacterium]|nr:hypothetical protein [Candidatus Omnitrophota bacterium]